MKSSIGPFGPHLAAQTVLYPSSYCSFMCRLSHPPENPAGCWGHCTSASAAHPQSTEQEDRLQAELLGCHLQLSLPVQHPGARSCMGGGGSRSTTAVQASQAALPACPLLPGLTCLLFVPPIHKTIESLRLEKTCKIIKSNHYPNTTMPAEPSPEVPHLHVL